MDSKRSIFEKPPPPPAAALRREDAISCLPEEVISCYCNRYELPVFKNLVYLSFGCKKNESGWKLLADMLKQSPKLETLIIEDLSGYTGDTSMPPLNQVKVLHILNHGCNDQELEVLESFVAEFKQLESYRVGVVEED
ncbi:unnamed protein product [Cochlearia groenlandica]